MLILEVLLILVFKISHRDVDSGWSQSHLGSPLLNPVLYMGEMG